MNKIFNVSADCKPELHYMVNIEPKLAEMKVMVERGDYFTINRARQYGKTTTLKALGRYLQKDYIILSLDFQGLSNEDFASESSFVEAFSAEILKKGNSVRNMPEDILNEIQDFAQGTGRKARLAVMFSCLSRWCEKSDKPIVLLIDEVDSAANNQVFLDFLAQLRRYYIDRDEVNTFQSVILASVYDVKNLKRKFAAVDGQKVNSPWNIAADFLVDMSFSVTDIKGMLHAYEADYGTGMDVEMIASLLYDYTSGYPFLVSRICKLIDERITGSMEYGNRNLAWTKEGVMAAVKIMLTEKNTLFESLIGKLTDYPELRELFYSLLFTGNGIPYSPLNLSVEVAEMFGFVKNLDGNVAISNRIFETVLYNLFLSEEALDNEIYKAALQDCNQFVRAGRLDMELVLEKFAIHFNDLYGDQEEDFLEDAGRRFFLLYLKPIINGTGNYYIESQTRNMERTDIVVDYRGEQFVIELKIWRGNAYNERGEKQLSDYLDYYHLKKGYMLSFNFNKKKQVCVKRVRFGDKELVEVIV